MKTIVSLVLAVVAAGCGKHGVVQPSPHEALIHGRVKDYQSEAPLSGVIRFESDSLGTVVGNIDAGAYTVTLPIGGFSVFVNDLLQGTSVITGSEYPGEVLVDTTTCISRYGRITDARTLKPVAGATVTVSSGRATTGPDGRYRIDLGCPSPPPIGGNTSFIVVTHPDYTQVSQIVGRGTHDVRLADFVLERSQ
jgi:hypothetical protein